VIAVAREHGGYVAGSDTNVERVGNRTRTTGSLRLRVRSDQFGDAFRAVKAVGEVRSASSDSEDVSDQLVDIEARLTNLRTQRDRLRRLYDEANDTEAVLQVGEKLSNVQQRIEQLQAQRRALRDEVAYATITVQLREPGLTPTPTATATPRPSYHETDLGGAIAASVNGVVVTVRAIVVTLAYVGPFALVFGLPLAAIGYVARQRDLF
jgi:chromosome segregation ATPase